MLGILLNLKRVCLWCYCFGSLPRHRRPIFQIIKQILFNYYKLLEVISVVTIAVINILFVRSFQNLSKSCLYFLLLLLPWIFKYLHYQMYFTSIIEHSVLVGRTSPFSNYPPFSSPRPFWSESRICQEKWSNNYSRKIMNLCSNSE